MLLKWIQGHEHIIFIYCVDAAYGYHLWLIAICSNVKPTNRNNNFVLEPYIFHFLVIDDYIGTVIHKFILIDCKYWTPEKYLRVD